MSAAKQKCFAALFYETTRILVDFLIFNAENDIFMNPSTWLGILSPFLSIEKYEISYISIIATLLCFILVPIILSVLIYFLFSISIKKTNSIKKNPYKNIKNDVIFENIYKMKPSEPDVIKVLKQRIHSVVWLEVACFAACFIVLMFYGVVQNTIKLNELGMGIFVIALVSPSSSISWYLLRWIEHLLFSPCYKLFNSIYKKRIKKPLGEVKESHLYIAYVDAKNARYHANLKREENERIKKERERRLYKEYIENSPAPPVFVEDIMRRMRENEAKNKPTPTSDPMGYGDGVPVDSAGM